LRYRVTRRRRAQMSILRRYDSAIEPTDERVVNE